MSKIDNKFPGSRKETQEQLVEGRKGERRLDPKISGEISGQLQRETWDGNGRVPVVRVNMS